MVLSPTQLRAQSSSELSFTKRREEKRREDTELSYFGLRRSCGDSGLIMCSQLTSPVNLVTRFLCFSLRDITDR